MELRQLQTFTQIAQMQSFSRTAEMLGYSQSAVTVQIRQLENELGKSCSTGQERKWCLPAGGRISGACQPDPL